MFHQVLFFFLFFTVKQWGSQFYNYTSSLFYLPILQIVYHTLLSRLPLNAPEWCSYLTKTRLSASNSFRFLLFHCQVWDRNHHRMLFKSMLSMLYLQVLLLEGVDVQTGWTWQGKCLVFFVEVVLLMYFLKRCCHFLSLFLLQPQSHTLTDSTRHKNETQP